MKFSSTNLNLGLIDYPILCDEIEDKLYIKNVNTLELQKFYLTTEQKKLIKAYEENENNVVKKERQVGATTATCAWISKKILEQGETVVIISPNINHSRDIVSKIYDFVRQWGDNRTIERRRDNFILSNRSIVKVVSKELDLHSYSPTILYFDEAAFLEKTNLWFFSLSSLKRDGKIILLSTPHIKDTIFDPIYNNVNQFVKTDMVTPIIR